MTVYEWVKMKWEKREKLQKSNKALAFSKNETLVQINEKARLHNLSYGQYVLARENGMYKEEYGTVVSLKHSPREAFCKARRFTR